VNGVAVFAFRFNHKIRNGIIYQYMPYDLARELSLGGFAINWSVAGFVREFRKHSRNLKIQKIIVGERRPAGGRMCFAIAKKER